jgi:hypothetical protein
VQKEGRPSSYEPDVLTRIRFFPRQQTIGAPVDVGGEAIASVRAVAGQLYTISIRGPAIYGKPGERVTAPEAVAAYSRTTSFGCWSVRNPRKTG